jgi:hypothetical protein
VKRTAFDLAFQYQWVETYGHRKSDCHVADKPRMRAMLKTKSMNSVSHNFTVCLSSVRTFDCFEWDRLEMSSAMGKKRTQEFPIQSERASQRAYVPLMRLKRQRAGKGAWVQSRWSRGKWADLLANGCSPRRSRVKAGWESKTHELRFSSCSSSEFRSTFTMFGFTHLEEPGNEDMQPTG